MDEALIAAVAASVLRRRGIVWEPGTPLDTQAREAAAAAIGLLRSFAGDGSLSLEDGKGFDLAAVFSYQLGGKLLDTNYAKMMDIGEYGYAQSPDLLNAWKQAGDITDVPRVDNNAAHSTNIGQSYSTRWLTSSNYLNLRSITLGYQLPKSWLGRVMLKSARLNLTMENLFMLKARQGLNPMANFSGITYNEYMPSRNITLGLNVSF